MIRTATLTFHASHNYGSMLQAYALQNIIQGLGCENEIINLRIDAQKRIYAKPSIGYNQSLKSNIKLCAINLLTGNKELHSKYTKFEDFLRQDLRLSNVEYSTLEELDSAYNYYDYIITGSDQIWNTNCGDFSWAYYLPFSKKQGVAYAPSMGPNSKEQVAEKNYDKIKNCLCNYKSISVREEGTADVVESILGKRPCVLVDPTMLLSKSDWENHIPTTPIISEPYIFVYTPFYNKDLFSVAKELSRILKIKVVVSNLPSIPGLIKYRNFEYNLDVGPWDFLNLIKNASLVLSGSFHAVVFSILLDKPFFAINGMSDNRISNIMRLMNLEARSIECTNVLSKANIAYDIDYKDKDAFLTREKERSIEFLKTSFGL